MVKGKQEIIPMIVASAKSSRVLKKAIISTTTSTANKTPNAPKAAAKVAIVPNILPFSNAAEWEMWLQQNHSTSKDVWIKMGKVKSGVPSVTLNEALDLCLCYGWIDSQRRSLDDKFYLQHYSPRRAKSPWSKINIDKVDVLIKAGRMREAGQVAIDAAKADGRWYVNLVDVEKK